MRIGIDIGTQRVYNTEFEKQGNDNVIMWEVLKTASVQKIKITFLESFQNSRQGIWFATDEYIELNGQKAKQIVLWSDTAPKEVIMDCHSKVGLLSFYNVWDDGNGEESQSFRSGMLLEIDNSISTYYCNDYQKEPDFKRLVFSVELL